MDEDGQKWERGDEEVEEMGDKMVKGDGGG